MPYRVTERLEGVASVLQALARLKASLRKKIIRRAVGAAGKVILKYAKARAPRETGLLRKSLGRKVKVYRNSGVAVAIVGPRTGFRKTVTRRRGKWLPTEVLSNPVKYAHLVELGTARTTAQPFLTPALKGQGAAIQAAIADEVNKGLAAEAARGK